VALAAEKWSGALRGAVFPLMGAIVVSMLIVRGYPAIRESHDTNTPPFAAMQWLRRNSSGPLLLGTALRPFADYYLSGRTVKFVDGPSAELSVPPGSPPTYLAGEGWVFASVQFSRPRRDLWDVVRQRYFEVYVLSPEHQVRFGPDWYQVEQSQTGEWRWMPGYATLIAPPHRMVEKVGFLFETADLTHSAASNVVLTVDGRRALQFQRRGIIGRSILLPVSPASGQVIAIDASPVSTPVGRRGSDGRTLGLELRTLEISP
jgi:hypothetical protein